jgi:predicted dehydrogenase
MIPFLVIGCGNIGALYDIDNDKVQTHAKAIYLDSRFSLAIYDPNVDLMMSVANKYKCDFFTEINENILNKFPCISICAPTNSHLQYILAGINSQAKLIICEKPISNDETELEVSRNAYLRSSTKIMVNYIRRFQPAYDDLKKAIQLISQTESVKNICIQYHRGFLNNCSHAFDLLEFLFDRKIEIEIQGKVNSSFDHFHSDPTVTLQGMWDKVRVNVIGLTDIKYSFFQIDIFLDTYRIALYDSGNTIKIYKVEDTKKTYQTLNVLNEYTQYNCLQNHMLHVIDRAFRIVDQEVNEDNFIQSIDLNKRMLNYLKG